MCSHCLKNDLNNPSYEGLQDTLRSLHRTRRAKFNRAMPDFPSSPDVNRRVGIQLFSNICVFLLFFIEESAKSQEQVISSK